MTRIQGELRMKTTAFVSIVVAMSVLAGPAAVADPIARNHPNSKHQPDHRAAVQGQGEKVAPESESDGASTTAESKDPDPRKAEARRGVSK
jgi:hypothetical protein